MRFRVTWSGAVNKTVAIDTPADALYHVWSRYKDDFTGGDVRVEVDEGGRGVRLARLGFPVRIEREVEARTLAEAVQFFLHDDRVPDLVHLHDINVVPVHDHDEAAPHLARAAE